MTEMIQKSLDVLTPVIIIGLIVYGFLIIRGLIESPVTEFLNTSHRDRFMP